MWIGSPGEGSASTPLRALSSAKLNIGRSVERLTSGHRINKAGDDAAGLAISEDVKATIRSRQQALRNIADGVSALQTADGGMVQIGEMLMRMRELALQSASGHYSDEQRELIQLEVGNLIEGIDETTTRCEFLDRYLLRGKLVDVAFIVDTSGSMGAEIAQIQSSIDSFYRSFRNAGISVEFGLVETVQDGTDCTNRVADIASVDFMSGLMNLSLLPEHQDPYSTMYNASGAHNTVGTIEPDALNFRSGAHRRFIYITDTGKEKSAPGIDPSESNLASALAAQEITVDFIIDTAHSGEFDEIAAATGGTIYSKGNANGNQIPNAMSAIANQVRDELGGGADPIIIQAGPDEEERIDIGIPLDLTPRALGIREVNVSTQEGALRALTTIDLALDAVSEGRAAVGASANALEEALDVQTHHIQNEAATKSRITDTDVAQETTELARGKILAQTATAMTAQVGRMQSERVLSLVQSGKVG